MEFFIVPTRRRSNMSVQAADSGTCPTRREKLPRPKEGLGDCGSAVEEALAH